MDGETEREAVHRSFLKGARERERERDSERANAAIFIPYIVYICKYIKRERERVKADHHHI